MPCSLPLIVVIDALPTELPRTSRECIGFSPTSPDQSLEHLGPVISNNRQACWLALTLPCDGGFSTCHPVGFIVEYLPAEQFNIQQAESRLWTSCKASAQPATSLPVRFKSLPTSKSTPRRLRRRLPFGLIRTIPRRRTSMQGGGQGLAFFIRKRGSSEPYRFNPELAFLDGYS